MKKSICLILLSVLIAMCLTSVAQAASEVTVLVNNNKIAFPDQKPYIDQNNRTLVPIRFVSEALGADVGWNGETSTVTITQKEKTIVLKIGENKASVNGQTKTFDTKAVIKNRRTMVPLRFVSECLGARVDWIAKTRTVVITVNNGYTIPEETELNVVLPPVYDNPNKVDIDILILLHKDLESQYTDLSQIISSKFGSKIASEIISYAQTKQQALDEILEKKWTINNHTISVMSEPGDWSINVIVWQPM